MKESNKVVLLRTGAFDWKVYGIYDSTEDMLKQLSEDWGDENLTIEDIEEETELRITYGTYYQKNQ